MNILALDLGNKFRFAVYKDGNVSFGSHRLSCKGFWTRFLKFRTWLLEIIKQNQIELVCFERVYRNKSQAAPMPKDLNIAVKRHASMLSAICSELGVKCKGFSESFIKKYITEGNKTKENMLSQAVPGRNVLGISGKRRASAIRGLLLLGKNSGKNFGKSVIKIPRGSFVINGLSGFSAPVASLASEFFQRLTVIKINPMLQKL